MTARQRQLVKNDWGGDGGGGYQKCGHFKVGSKTGGGDKNKDESRVENIRTQSNSVSVCEEEKSRWRGIRKRWNKERNHYKGEKGKEKGKKLRMKGISERKGWEEINLLPLRMLLFSIKKNNILQNRNTVIFLLCSV